MKLTRSIVCQQLNGILALWKPAGISSAKFCDQFKAVLHKEIDSTNRHDIIKVGHGGTLDMSASGVLAVGLGSGCKMLKYLLAGSKVYQAVGCLGIETDTYNDDGALVGRKSFDHITMNILTETSKKFLGQIRQSPPVFSALKHYGMRLSDMAREGLAIPEEKLVPRTVSVYSIKVLDFSPPHFTVEICCSGGFYVRSFIHDIGIALDTYAHMVSLTRTQHGPFTTDHVLPESHWTYPEILNELNRTAKMRELWINVRKKKS